MSSKSTEPPAPMELVLPTREATILLGERIGLTLHAGDIVALTGPLGAGKTTLAKGVARALGVNEEITSPTFTIVSEYSGRLTLYHVDLYRIGSEEEVELLGLEELLYSDGVSLVEWSEKAPHLFVDPITIRLAISGPTSRTALIAGLKHPLPKEHSR